MAKKRKLFEELREGLTAYRDKPGTLVRREVDVLDVKAIREKFSLSQSQFAAFLDVSKRTLENWEQERAMPQGFGLAAMLMIEGIRCGAVARDRTIAMLIIFAFNILFWMFYEQAGNSFTFLADQIVNRDLGGFIFPTAWFQSVPALAVILFAPIAAWLWVWMAKRHVNPSIPRKFGLGLLFNGLAFLLLMFALSNLVSDAGKIPFWTLLTAYLIQVVGELCLSPIGLSMVTKLAPVRLVGLGMGGWFLSTGIGNNLSGIFASAVSGETGMTTTSALSGYTFGFWALVGSGAVLFLIAPLIQRLMHGVK